MGQNSRPLTGTCRCGRSAFEVAAPPIITAACHCQGCRRMSSSAFSLTAIVPAPAFRVTQGAPVRGGAKGPDLEHFCCPDCMTWMFTRIAGMPDIVNVRSALLDDLKWSRPFIETMTEEKLDWVETPARHSYEGFPPPEDFGRLMQEFAENH